MADRIEEQAGCARDIGRIIFSLLSDKEITCLQGSKYDVLTEFTSGWICYFLFFIKKSDTGNPDRIRE
jgi:hypothetical protein